MQDHDVRQQRHEHIVTVIMARLSMSQERRSEALEEYLALAMPNMDDAVSSRLAGMIPPVMDDLYRKWAGMFAESLLERLPKDQLAYLTNGEDDNNAALALAYIMFMESERMEKQMTEDLREYGLSQTGEGEEASLAADFLQAKAAELAKGMKK